MSTILAISSRVVRGTVGNALATFVLQRMGHEVWDVPTVIWDHHPGYGKPSGLVLTGAQIATLVADLRLPETVAETGMVLSGYFANRDQIDAVAAHIRAVKASMPGVKYCCDPICGDAPGPYVPAEVVAGLREVLVPLADVITPNRFELGFLSGLPVSSNVEIVTAARALGRPLCLVTSAFGDRPAHIANLLITPNAVWRCFSPRQAHVPNGTGDLMTALFAGWLAAGVAPPDALGRAAAGVQGVVRATRSLGQRSLAITAAQDQFAAGETSLSVEKFTADGSTVQIPASHAER